jgi:WD40 repeat protein/tRNA A-37 threonylcarbamoyl transferase component Bud32
LRYLSREMPMPDAVADDPSPSELHKTALDVGLEAFHAALRRGERPALEAFVPASADQTQALVELVHAEMEFRLKRGEAARVEEYLARYPELADSDGAVVDLVAAEYALRRRRGDKIHWHSYLTLFPRQRDALAAHFRRENAEADEPTVVLGDEARAEHGANVDLPRLSGYVILSELGHGAMGVVYKARHLALNRLVALKMLHDSRRGQAEMRARFRGEVEIIARLQHPNIVQVYDVGEHEGRPFFTMEYLDGGSWADRYRDRPQTPPSAATLIETLARAIHAVHLQGIVHRDLKPSNVMRGAEGCPKITDFGLAHRECSDLTATGELLGTPSYMAPEQAAGKTREIAAATDVYALGVILYELLTGRVPFRGVSVMEVVRQVQESDPLPPRRLETAIPRDLETICLKCLRKEPSRRYASAAALADDLRRFQNGEAIEARPMTKPERVVRWGRRHPAATVSLAVALVLAAAVPLALLGHTLRLQETLEREQAAHDQADQAEQLARLHENEAHAGNYVSDVHLAHNLFKIGDKYQLSRILQAYDGEEWGGSDPRGFEWTYLQRQRRKTKPALTAHDGPLHLLAYSPDGGSLVTGGGNPNHPTLQVWDPRTRRYRFRHTLHGFTPNISALRAAYSPGGAVLAGRINDTNEVVLWDFASGRKKRRFTPATEPINLELSPNGRWLAVRGTECTEIWDTAGEHRQCTIPIATNGMAFAPNADWIVAARGHADFTGLQWWNPQTGALLKQTGLPRGAATPSFSPRGTYLLFLEGGKGAIWHAAQCVPLFWSEAIGPVHCLAVSPDERTLASGDGEGTVRLWDIATGRALGQYHWQATAIHRLAFAPDNRTLAAATAEGVVQQLDATIPPVFECLQTNSMRDVAPAWSPDGETVAAAGAGGTVHLFDRRDGKTRRILRCPHQNVRCLAFAPDGRTLATVCEHERFARLWNAKSGELLGVTSPQSSPITRIAFCPDGRLASVDDKTIRFWDAAKGSACGVVETDASIQALAFVPKGRFLVTANTTIQVWEMSNGRSPRKKFSLPRAESPIVHLAVHRDGRCLAAGQTDGTVRLWRISNEGTLTTKAAKVTWPGERTPLANLQFRGGGDGLLLFSPQRARLCECPDGRYQDVLIGDLKSGMLSPDGRTLAIVSGDGVLRLWDVAAWRTRQPHGQTLNRVTSLIFSVDGRTLITASRVPGFFVYNRKLVSFETAPLRNTTETLRLWDAAAGVETADAAPQRETMAPPYLVAQSPDGRLLAAGGEDGSVQIWEGLPHRENARLFVSEAAEWRVKTLELARQLWPRTNPNYSALAEGVSALAFSADGRLMATGGSRGSIRVWNTGDWQEAAHWQGDANGVPWLVFSPDGQGLAGSRGGQAFVWAARTGRALATLGTEGDAAILCGIFSPQKNILALGSKDGVLCFWNPRDGSVQRLAGRHQHRVTSLAFAPDGKTLASGSWDHTVRVWNVRTRRELLTLEGHRGRVNTIAFSPDGATLASGGDVDVDGGEVLLWR